MGDLLTLAERFQLFGTDVQTVHKQLLLRRFVERDGGNRAGVQHCGRWAIAEKKERVDNGTGEDLIYKYLVTGSDDFLGSMLL